MDISRVANIGTVSQSTLTKPSDQRTEDKSSTLASEHTDSFIRKGTIYTPAYTRKSAQKQNAEQNLLQREDSEDAVGKIKEQESPESAKQTLVSRGVSHIIRAMFVKQGEVLSGTVPSVGAEMYAEELLRQIRILYGNSAAEENTPEYWQPDETAARLLTFFDSVSIDAPDRRLALEHAFTSAFNDTEQLFGGRGRLPLESYETKKMVMDSYFS
ncbi:MAG: hypothetical protein ACI4JY_03440 [Oscillospiraceae bacterium]